MSVLGIIQDSCRLMGLNVPTVVVTSTDQTVQQLFGILKEIVDEIVEESRFNVVTREATFTAVAAEDQGDLNTIATYGFQWIINDTLYDRTLRRPLYGPLDEQQWQAIKALPNPGPFYKYRVRGDHLLINPAPTVPLSTIAFEYVSSWATTDAGGTPKAAPTADNDLFLFPDNILRRGVQFRWKQIKGLPYQSDESKYYDLLNNYIARDKTRPQINVSEPYKQDIKPGIFVPSGNWMT